MGSGEPGVLFRTDSWRRLARLGRCRQAVGLLPCARGCACRRMLGCKRVHDAFLGCWEQRGGPCSYASTGLIISGGLSKGAYRPGQT